MVLFYDHNMIGSDIFMELSFQAFRQRDRFVFKSWWTSWTSQLEVYILGLLVHDSLLVREQIKHFNNPFEIIYLLFSKSNILLNLKIYQNTMI